MAPSLSAVLYGDVVAHFSGSEPLWLPCNPQLLKGGVPESQSQTAERTFPTHWAGVTP